jgi:hypothetical protein
VTIAQAETWSLFRRARPDAALAEDPDGGTAAEAPVSGDRARTHTMTEIEARALLDYHSAKSAQVDRLKMHLELMREPAREFPKISEPLAFRSARIRHCNYTSLSDLAMLADLEVLVTSRRRSSVRHAGYWSHSYQNHHDCHRNRARAARSLARRLQSRRRSVPPPSFRLSKGGFRILKPAGWCRTTRSPPNCGRRQLGNIVGTGSSRSGDERSGDPRNRR